MMYRMVLALVGISLVSSCQTRGENQSTPNTFKSLNGEYFAVEPEGTDVSGLMCAYVRKKDKSSFLDNAEGTNYLPVKEEEFLDLYFRFAYLENFNSDIEFSKMTVEEFNSLNDKEQKRLAQLIIIRQIIAVAGTATTYTGITAIGILAYPWVQVTVMPALGALLSNKLFVVAAGALLGSTALASAAGAPSLDKVPLRLGASVVLTAGIAAFGAFAVSMLPAALFESMVNEVKLDKRDREEAYIAAMMAKKRALFDAEETEVSRSLTDDIERTVRRLEPVDQGVKCPSPDKAWDTIQNTK